MTHPNRTQHAIASGVVFLVGATVCWISYTQEPAEAFVFPRLIATVFVVLAAWTFVKALLGRSKVGDGLTQAAFLNLLPGTIIALIYVFWAAEDLGFYTATGAAFFILLSLYDPKSHLDWRSWVKRLLISAIFIAVMYSLFSKALSVYTPRGVLHEMLDDTLGVALDAVFRILGDVLNSARSLLGGE